MKLFKSASLAFVALAAICLSSCVSTKKIKYFQGSEYSFIQPQEIQQLYEMHIKPADQVLIKVTCDQPELLEVFNLDVTMGSGSRTGTTNYGSNSTMGNIYGYTVDNEGYLTLPHLGRVHVANLTCDDAAKVIENQIKSLKMIKNPDVTVRLLNARVAVLGAVRSPHVVSLTSERNTILDVISQCGDVSDQALRQKVQLYREDNGKRVMYELDLTSADIFNSPAFYVQQNDLVYIQPNKSQNVKSSAFSTFLGVGGSIISAISSAVAIVIAVTRK
jgi:polysaccharide export outer membrane protein